MSMNGDSLGQAMYDAVHAIASGSSEADALARMKALGNAIVAHISANATIAPLSSTETPIIGTSVHVHTPILTTSATGKIS